MNLYNDRKPGNRLTAIGCIKGHVIYALNDSGADCSVANLSKIQSLGFEIGKSEFGKLKAASGNLLQVVGEVKLPLQFAGRDFPWCFVVVDNLTSDFIIGVDFLKQCT